MEIRAGSSSVRLGLPPNDPQPSEAARTGEESFSKGWWWWRAEFSDVERGSRARGIERYGGSREGALGQRGGESADGRRR